MANRAGIRWCVADPRLVQRSGPAFWACSCGPSADPGDPIGDAWQTLVLRACRPSTAWRFRVDVVVGRRGSEPRTLRLKAGPRLFRCGSPRLTKCQNANDYRMFSVGRRSAIHAGTRRDRRVGPLVGPRLVCWDAAQHFPPDAEHPWSTPPSRWCVARERRRWPTRRRTTRHRRRGPGVADFQGHRAVKDGSLSYPRCTVEPEPSQTATSGRLH